MRCQSKLVSTTVKLTQWGIKLVVDYTKQLTLFMQAWAQRGHWQFVPTIGLMDKTAYPLNVYIYISNSPSSDFFDGALFLSNCVQCNLLILILTQLTNYVNKDVIFTESFQIKIYNKSFWNLLYYPIDSIHNWPSIGLIFEELNTINLLHDHFEAINYRLELKYILDGYN